MNQPATEVPNKGRVRLPSPVVQTQAAERIRQAAEKTGRSVSNFIARAAISYADSVMAVPAAPVNPED